MTTPPQPTIRTARRRWRTALNIGGRVAVGVVILGIIVSRSNLQAVGHAASQMAPGLAAGAAVCMLLVAMITAAKWLILLRALHIPVATAEVVRLTYIAVTWNLALPGGESGNLVKAVLLARQQPRLAGAVWASMLVDQFSLAAAQLLVAFSTLLLAQHPPPGQSVWFSVILGGVVAIGAIYALFLLPLPTVRLDRAVVRLSRTLAAPPWLRRLAAGPEPVVPTEVQALEAAEQPQHQPGEWLAPLWSGLIRYRRHAGALFGAMGVAVLYYGMIFLAYWLAARGLGLPYGYADIAWVTALAGIAALLPITVAGAGVREGIIVFFLTQHGTSAEAALTFSLAVLALNIVLGIPGLFAQLFRRPGS